MQERSWLQVVGIGALVGCVATLAMTCVMLLLRYELGVPTPAELVGDRLAPTLTIAEFFELLERYGGYNELKQGGVSSVLIGQFAVGVLGGILYASLLRVGRGRPPHSTGGRQRWRRGLLTAGLLVGILWLATIIALWPTLGTHYAGSPPGRANTVTIVGLLLSYGTYGVVLVLASRLMAPTVSASAATSGTSLPGRRMALAAGLGAVAAIVSGVLLRRLYDLATFSYDGLRYSGPDIEPITPNDRFYVVSKNVIDPHISRAIWRLEVTGLVEQPQVYRYPDLLAMPTTSQETTLECISNDIGDGLMSNARWQGIPLQRLLEAARPWPNVVDVRFHAADGYTDSISFEKAMDPTTLLVYEMNGEPLPQRHGFPTRLIAPGLFGKNNVKWVTRIELLDAHVKGFYEQQGWGPSFVVPTTSRFDYPTPGQVLRAPTGTAVRLKGIAYAGARGVSRVEVSVDARQTWQEAHLDYQGAPMAWVLWSYDWQPAQTGMYKLAVRAEDGAGTPQTADYRSFAPEGATGYHLISVGVEI
jgi:DMSO/TMAO reductase YedYZ molybdopterin-dependent catalytic subunit